MSDCYPSLSQTPYPGAWYYDEECGGWRDAGGGVSPPPDPFVRSSTFDAAMAGLPGTYQPLAVSTYKTANQGITSTSTVDVTDMVLPVEADTVYEFRADIYVVSAVGGSTPDIRVSFTVPTGATGKLAPIGPAFDATGSSPTSVAVSMVARDWASTFTLGTFANSGVIRIHGLLIVSSTAGNVQLRARQNTSDANPVTIELASFMRADPL